LKAISGKPLHNPFWQGAHDFPSFAIPAKGLNSGIGEAIKVKEAIMSQNSVDRDDKRF
jgi:hypothetical protein